MNLNLTHGDVSAILLIAAIFWTVYWWLPVIGFHIGRWGAPSH